MKLNRKHFRICVFLVALLIISICFIFGNQLNYSYQVPEQTDDGWETSSLTDVGMNTEPLTKLMNELLRSNDISVHSILVVKDNKLVFEEYFSGANLNLTNLDLTNSQLDFIQKNFDQDTLHCQCSASKSITSILVGIAIDQGLIQDVQQTRLSFFPEYSYLNDAEKEKITLKHMLMMASGIPWDESSFSYTDPRNDLNQMVYNDDPIEYMFEKPVVAQPGTQFNYNSGTTDLLGDIVRRSTGLTLIEFAKQYLFTPLGITSFDWAEFPKAPDVAMASSGLYLRPRDMAKIGQLYLQKGVWNGNQIVSEGWVTESTLKSISVPYSKNPIPELVTGYGYQWWQGTFQNGNTETYFAGGWGGQFIFVIPDLDMVIVFTGGNFENAEYQGFYNLVNDYILDAVFDFEYDSSKSSFTVHSNGALNLQSLKKYAETDLTNSSTLLFIMSFFALSLSLFFHMKSRTMKKISNNLPTNTLNKTVNITLPFTKHRKTIRILLFVFPLIVLLVFVGLYPVATGIFDWGLMLTQFIFIFSLSLMVVEIAPNAYQNAEILITAIQRKTSLSKGDLDVFQDLRKTLSGIGDYYLVLFLFFITSATTLSYVWAPVYDAYLALRQGLSAQIISLIPDASIMVRAYALWAIMGFLFALLVVLIQIIIWKARSKMIG